MFELIPYVPKSIWNKGKLVGQKLPLKLEEIWAIRIRLQLSNNLRGLAMFNLALDSKLRACDLIKLKVRDIEHGEAIPLLLRPTTFAFAHWQSVIRNYYCKRHRLY